MESLFLGFEGRRFGMTDTMGSRLAGHLILTMFDNLLRCLNPV